MEEKRKLLHEILDLVIDINGFEQRKAAFSDKPAAFFEFSGHIASASVSIHDHGWIPDVHADFDMTAWDCDGIDGLKKLREELIRKKDELDV